MLDGSAPAGERPDLGDGAAPLRDPSDALASTIVGSVSTIQPRVLGPIPETLGRYRILDVLGVGGMGVVYTAHDPELERDVALKVLGARSHDAKGTARLQREARTLARLAHPNVVSIYDVGETDGQLFIAMERIEGATLRAWLEAAPRRWQAIVAIFVAAGRGLVAAHEAGLVHRDFKPDNVLVDERGTPRVVDFGLARAVEGGPPVTAAETISERLEAPLELVSGLMTSATLTMTGAVMGTPAYMSPEQHLSDPSDARTDQFAFCVSLWEALYRERPFPGENLEALRDAVVNGRLRAPQRRVGPRALLRALRRGLNPDPARRWPDLSALLDALEAIPRRRRLAWTALGGGALGAALIAGTWTYAAQTRAAPACAASDARVAAVWGGERRAAVVDALADAGLAPTEDVHVEAPRRLDAYAAALAGGFEAACVDAEHRLLSAALHDRRIRCLVASVDAFDATVGVLESLGREDVPAITRLLAALPPVDRCADLEALGRAPHEPDDEVLAARLAEVRAALTQASVAEVAGRSTAAEEALRRARALSEGVDHPPLVSELQLAEAKFAGLVGDHRRSIAAAEEAYHAALAVGVDSLAVEASVLLVHTYSHGLHDPENALAWGRHAASMSDRIGDPDARATLLEYRGEVAVERHQLDEANELFAAAIAAKRELHGAESLDVADALHHRAITLGMLDRTDAAEQALREALAIHLAELGELSPTTAATLSDLGYLLAANGDYAAALESSARALDIEARLYGADDINVVRPLIYHTQILGAVGRHADAVAAAERGLRIVRQDAHHLEYEGRLLENLGVSALAVGDYARAREAYADALAIATDRDFDPHGRFFALIGLASVDNADGAYAAAIERAGEALALLVGEHIEAVDVAGAHLQLARGHLGLGAEERARQHAARARVGFAEAGPTHAPDLAQAEALLTELGVPLSPLPARVHSEHH
ncbi:MAG: serine/threonine-protein kinase [Nannocystaceae bacterium]